MKASRSQYRQAMRLSESIAFLKEILGPADRETTITLSNAGTCGLRNILEYLQGQAVDVACGGIMPYEIEFLAGMKLPGSDGNE